MIPSDSKNTLQSSKAGNDKSVNDGPLPNAITIVCHIMNALHIRGSKCFIVGSKRKSKNY